MTLDIVQSATNFCNVNNNGNANNWNASNSIGVRPDFTTVHPIGLDPAHGNGKGRVIPSAAKPINANRDVAGYDRCHYCAVYFLWKTNCMMQTGFTMQAPRQ